MPLFAFSVSHITDYEAREALLDYVHEACCYGTRAAKEMQILKVIPSCALQVILIYMNTRSTPTGKHPLNLIGICTLLIMTITAQWEGMGDVGSARHELALLLLCPTIKVLNYSNCQRSTLSMFK